MTPKPAHWAQIIFELTKDAVPAGAEQTVEALARTLRKKNKQGILERVLAEYRKLLLKRNLSSEVFVGSAVPLPLSVKNAILKMFHVKEDAIVKETVDSSLVGGLIVKHNDMFFDSSLQHKLARLEEAITRE